MSKPARMLFPWLSSEQAVASQLGRQPLVAENVEAQVHRWEHAREALHARPEYQPRDEVLEELPATLQERARQFKENAHTRNVLQSLDWKIGIADLGRVLSFQYSVTLDRISERLGDVQADEWDKLFSICMPNVPALEELRFSSQIEERAFTISTTNPNLRILGPVQGIASIAPDPSTPTRNVPQVGFAIDLGTPFIQVVEFQRRWFIRDGYHRCYGLLQRGINRIPCVFVKARDFSETGANRPGFIGQEVLMGPRPPMLTDFLDITFSIDVRQPSIVKVVRVVAQEFMVNADDLG